MKLAVIGSRKLTGILIENYVDAEVDEIVSGGAVGIDTCAAEYARNNGLKLTEFLPQYDRYGRAAPLMRNKTIVEYADKIIAFWDGKSKGTLFVIDYAKSLNKSIRIVICE